MTICYNLFDAGRKGRITIKNPNGYGSVYKLSGNRRKPWAVRLTVGRSPEGKQIYKMLGYYKTRKDANIALADYNHEPYNLDANNITFIELFEKWKAAEYPHFSHDSIKMYNSAIIHCESLYKMRFNAIRTNHLQAAVDACPRGFATKKKMRFLFGKLYQYAMSNDLSTKSYSQFVKVGTKETDERVIFTKHEVLEMFELAKHDEYYELVLILLYTGMRIRELLTLERKNVFIHDKYAIGGLKTKAGKNRIIPLHNSILPLVAKRMEHSGKYLVKGKVNEEMPYTSFNKEWRKRPLLSGHKTHDTRHTLISNLHSAEVPEITIKLIVGHAQKDVTGQVYIHKMLPELLEAINRL